MIFLKESVWLETMATRQFMSIFLTPDASHLLLVCLEVDLILCVNEHLSNFNSYLIPLHLFLFCVNFFFIATSFLVLHLICVINTMWQLHALFRVTLCGFPMSY